MVAGFTVLCQLCNMKKMFLNVIIGLTADHSVDVMNLMASYCLYIQYLLLLLGSLFTSFPLHHLGEESVRFCSCVWLLFNFAMFDTWRPCLCLPIIYCMIFTAEQHKNILYRKYYLTVWKTSGVFFSLEHTGDVKQNQKKTYFYLSFTSWTSIKSMKNLNVMIIYLFRCQISSTPPGLITNCSAHTSTAMLAVLSC